MPYYLIEFIDLDGFVQSRIIQNLTKPTIGNIKDWMNILPGHYEGQLKIEKLSDCYGCSYECSGQKDHMECPDGCLHNKTSCKYCE